MTKGRLAKEVVLWMITLFLALVCLRSGLTKMQSGGFWARDFMRWGYPAWFQPMVGSAELISFVLLLLPRLASYGALIFAIVMIGAIFTHSTHHEVSRLPFNFLLLGFSLLIIFTRKPASFFNLRK